MGFNCRFLLLMLLLHNQASLALCTWNVTCDKQNICDVKGAQLIVSCSYSKINFKTGFWFSQKQRTNWRNKEEPEDLTLDSDYSGRVKQEITKRNSKLFIDDLRERDSGEYQLMFIMKDGVKHLSSVTVNLTLTDLHVRMNPVSSNPSDQRIILTCDSSCKLKSSFFYWRKDLVKDAYETDSLKVSMSLNTDYGSYSCSVNDWNINPSSVCVSKSGCWGVTYTSTRVCALVGSTVDIHSSYSHPTGYTVVKTSWHYIIPDLYPWRPYLRRKRFVQFPLDLRKDHQFAGSMQFVGNTLRIKDVNMSDTGRYVLRIISNTSDGFRGYPGVILTVTGTRVTSSPNPVIDGEKVILSCSTECTLDSNHTYIWYKNGQQITDGLRLLNKLYLNSINSKELQEYSCTVREEPVEILAAEHLHFGIFLIVFAVQVLSIAAIWVWFCLKKKIKWSKNKLNDKNKENPTSGSQPTLA